MRALRRFSMSDMPFAFLPSSGILLLPFPRFYRIGELVPKLAKRCLVEHAVRQKFLQEAAQVAGDLERRPALEIAQPVEELAGGHPAGIKDFALGSREIPEPPQADGPTAAHSHHPDLAEAAGTIEHPGRCLPAGGPREKPEEVYIPPAVPGAAEREELFPRR